MKKILSLGLLLLTVFLLSGCSAAGRYDKRGEKNFLSGNYEEAAMNFSKAAEQNPNRADYYINNGMALSALGRYEEAMAQFDHVIMDKDIPMVKENNKRALRGKGITYYNRKKYEDAVSQFDAALEIGVLSELDMDILYYKGNALMTMGNYTEAEEAFTGIIGTFGNDAKALGSRAYTYRRTGEYEKSLADYDLAVSLDKGCFEYYFGKYYVKMEMGDEAGAADVLSEAAAIEDVTKEDHYNLAKVHFYQGLYEQSLPEFGESLAEGYTESYFYIGEIYGKQKDYSTAVYYYDKYIGEGEVTAPIVYNQIASCKMKLGEYEDAARYLETGVGLDPAGRSRILMKNRVVAYENLGEFDTALQMLKEYLAVFPEDDQAKREEEFLLTRQIDVNVENNDEIQER